MTEKELQDMLKARDMLDAQPVPEISPESLHNIMDAMGYAPRSWVGLTEDEAIGLLPEGEWEVESTLEFAQAIEATLKKKNT